MITPASDHPSASNEYWYDRIREFMDECYFDVHSTPPLNKLNAVIDEAALARLLTKLAVGSATVWWSLLELKEMVSLCRKARKNKSL